MRFELSKITSLFYLNLCCVSCTFPLCPKYSLAPTFSVKMTFRLLKEVESAVDVYHRYNWEDYWFENLKAVCEFLNLDFKNTTFIPNATAGK